MRRRILSALLAAAMVAALALPISAAASVSEEEIAQVIGAVDIMVGDETGNLNLGRTVTRAEFITMAVKASPQGDQVGEASVSPYPDVPRKHWAAAYVQAGVRSGLITGYLDGTFRPNNQITLAEGATIALKLLGYTGSDFSGAYPTAQMALANSLDLTDGLSARNSGDVLNRRDSMYLFYNLLSAPTKNGHPYINTLGYSLNAAGEVDRVALLSKRMDGPIVADGSWRSQIPFSLTGATISRAGKTIQAGEVNNGELLYWNEGMRRVWVYTDKVTGTIQALNPSAANPTSVTLAGRTYALETSSAVYALSEFGSFRVGDTVTLLLGHSGGAAAVVAPSAGDTSKIGIVTAVTKNTYTQTNGSTYADDTVTFMGTDGQTYSYQWTTRYFSVGDLIQVVVDSQGSTTLKRLQRASVSGKVSADAKTMGSYPLAADVEILDTCEQSGVKIYPSRLAGASITTDDVYYYALNPQGEIQYLILDDFTGDIHTYGVVTGLSDMSAGMSILVTYTLDIRGQSMVFTSQNKKYPVEKGPFIIKGSVTDPDTFTQLKSVRVDRINGSVATAGSLSFDLFDNVIYYEYRDGGYYLSNLDRVNSGDYSNLTVWYDKTQGQGGCARIVIAK